MVHYLLVFPDRADAETVAHDLREETDFAEVRVIREALAGEDDSEDHDWAVYVRIETLDDPTSAPARALTDRFTALAQEHGGWLDEDVSPTS
ncbi:hypothetical protein [Demetria terragena]|uniref:hypothetical protein n=1 Tax=Demetria terragena TaxID=63959 RepID=UPI000362087A|nr:hypothetical protein [Demetria terragena]